MNNDKTTPEYWSDWVVDAAATASQNRILLRGDPEEDKILTEAVYLNALKAMNNLLKHRESNETR